MAEHEKKQTYITNFYTNVNLNNSSLYSTHQQPGTTFLGEVSLFKDIIKNIASTFGYPFDNKTVF